MEKKVPFHEDGRRYFWGVASKTITDSAGGVVQNGRKAYNLEQARAVVNPQKKGAQA